MLLLFMICRVENVRITISYLKILAYPSTPASIGFPVAAYSNILEGRTFLNARDY